MTTYVANVMNRVSLPSEFYDIVNSKMLIAPTPQLPYAQAAIAALGKELEVPDNINLPFRGTSGNAGAPYLKLEEMQLNLNPNPLFSEIVAAKVDFAAKFGATMRFNRPSFATSTYTLASRIVGPNQTLSTTPVAVTAEQTSLTLLRLGGPYDSTNGVSPIAIENFDANMSVHKLVEVAGLTLVYDYHRTLEGIITGLLDLGTAIYPGTASADSDFTAVSDFPMDVETIRRAEATADTNSLPVFSDGYRIAVLHPTQILQLQSDDEYQKQAVFMPEYNTLKGYVKTISRTHIFRSPTLTETTNGTVKVCKGHFICPQSLLVGMGRPVSVRQASDDNFGETPKILWLGDMAFGLADSRFVYTLRSATTTA